MHVKAGQGDTCQETSNDENNREVWSVPDTLEKVGKGGSNRGINEKEIVGDFLITLSPFFGCKIYS